MILFWTFNCFILFLIGIFILSLFTLLVCEKFDLWSSCCWLLTLKCSHSFNQRVSVSMFWLDVKCCFAGSYPQQAVYPQQSTAPVYPPAMQMSPQAPPYTDTPPAYSEVTLSIKSSTITQVILAVLNIQTSLFIVSVYADIPAQICASTSGAWSVASDVLSLPWCSGVHAHAATHACWASGSECPHGLLPHGNRVPAWFNSDGGRWLWCGCSLQCRQQRFHPSEYSQRSVG